MNLITFILTSSSIIGWILYIIEKKKNKPTETVEVTLNDEPEGTLIDSTQSNKEMERLSIVARQTENAIMIMDPDGNIEWVNEGFTRMYGYTYSEFVSKLGSNIRQTSFNGAIEERLYSCTHLGKPVFYEALNITKNGDSIWTHTSLTPIYDDTGKLAYLATIDSDISRRKESGDELLKAIEHLSSRINSLSVEQKKLIHHTAKMMEDIGESAKLLEESTYIARFINDISDKVKILGLNASIEAATIQTNTNGSRHATNGFRVISGEIIKLSDDSKKQASNIANVMGRLQTAFGNLESNRTMVNEVASSFFDTVKEVRQELVRVEHVADQLNA